ncbi:hypothetical protein ADUPG1_011076, partial [Aduncisulcus paluster]
MPSIPKSRQSLKPVNSSFFCQIDKKPADSVPNSSISSRYDSSKSIKPEHTSSSRDLFHTSLFASTSSYSSNIPDFLPKNGDKTIPIASQYGCKIHRRGCDVDLPCEPTDRGLGLKCSNQGQQFPILPQKPRSMCPNPVSNLSISQIPQYDYKFRHSAEIERLYKQYADIWTKKLSHEYELLLEKAKKQEIIQDCESERCKTHPSVQTVSFFRKGMNLSYVTKNADIFSSPGSFPSTS